MTRFNRRTTPKVTDGRVQKKNRHAPTPTYWNTHQKVPGSSPGALTNKNKELRIVFDRLPAEPRAYRNAVATSRTRKTPHEGGGKACNLRDQYWLYVAFNCASPRPRLVRVRDPFGNLLVKTKGGVMISSAEVLSAAEPGGV